MIDCPPHEARFDVLCIGELNPDLIISGIEAAEPELGCEQTFRSESLTLGSSTAITCVLLQRLGLRTAMVSMVGNDRYGRFCIDQLNTNGVDTHAIRTTESEATGITLSVSYASDRLLLTRHGTMATFSAAEIDRSLLQRTRHVHVGSFYLLRALQSELPALFAEAHRCGASTSLDTGCDPAGLWAMDQLHPLLPQVDALLPNRSELAGISQETDLDVGITALQARGVGEVALKLGPEGAIVSNGSDRARHAGFSVPVHDTTGAGDAFNAGYLRARLAGLELQDRLAMGNACGAISVQAVGGTGGLSGLDVVVALLEAREQKGVRMTRFNSDAQN